MVEQNHNALISVTLPYSEVCMHMGVAGMEAKVEPIDNNMAQIWMEHESTGELKRLSFPVTRGEAGLSYV